MKPVFWVIRTKLTIKSFKEKFDCNKGYNENEKSALYSDAFVSCNFCKNFCAGLEKT